MPKLPLKITVLLAVAAIGVLAIPAQARASACSKALIHDWYVDARIDKTYPVRCYREALKNIPEDQIVYGTLRDDLQRALQSAVRSHGGKVRPETLIPGKGPNGPKGGSGGGGKDGFFYWVSRKLGPGTADSIPIPLLVLGGLALLLLGAAGVSYLARYYQTRRAQPAPAPAPPKPRP